MEIRLLRLPALVALLVISLAAVAQAKPKPTAAQVRVAVQHAKRSKDLWATINVCNTKRYPNTIGIRGQMPSLGFATQLRMRFGIEYWTGRSFTPLSGLTKSIALETAGSGVHQVGVMFTFRPHAGLLRGSVSFEWRLRHREVGQSTRLTRAGHHDADYADPKGFSSSQCGIP